MSKTVVFIVLMLTLTSHTASSNSNGQQYSLKKYVISSGGGDSASSMGDFKLSATIGQPVTSKLTNSGDFSLTTGFWNAQDSFSDIIFSDGFESTNFIGENHETL